MIHHTNDIAFERLSQAISAFAATKIHDPLAYLANILVAAELALPDCPSADAAEVNIIIQRDQGAIETYANVIDDLANDGGR
jgi:hypothetical protein